MTHIFIERGGKVSPHEYFERSFTDELSPGGCYPSSVSQLWLPETLGPSEDYRDYTSTMTYPDLAQASTEEYATADNGGRVMMRRSTKTDYLVSLGWNDRFIPSGQTIMQQGVTGRNYSEYGLFDSCDDATLTIVRYPQLSYNSGTGKSRLLSYFQTLDFSIRSSNGTTFTLFPFLSLQLSQSADYDDPPTAAGVQMTQDMTLAYFPDEGSSASCSTTLANIPVLVSTQSEWATLETTISLRLFGPATEPRRARATISNANTSQTLDLQFGETPLCHCTQGGCFRVQQTYNPIEAVINRDFDITPDNYKSIELATA